MTKVERCFSLIGLALIGLAAYLVKLEQGRLDAAATDRDSPPVEALGDRLKEAWAGHHNP
jgi:hypothetical protein